MLKRLIERSLIKILKYLKVDLLCHAHVQQGVGHNTFNSGEEFVITYLIAVILKKEPGVVFDVGANTGEYANLVNNRFKNSIIHCFEPVPQNYEKLKQNVTSANAVLHNIAMGSEDGHLTLFLSSDNPDGAMATAYKDTIENIFTFAGNIVGGVDCVVTSIDNFCKGKIDEIDFLKIDVEGHELEVLKGAANLISENRIKVIQFEFNEFNIFSRSFLWDFYQLLPNHNFYRILPRNKLLPLNEYNSINEIFRYQNILAVNKSLNYNYAG